MKLIRKLSFEVPCQARASYNRRLGVTLSEVLISMLIMSIGVVSLATLFPISVLRSAQATQLTHAVFLRNNAEAFVESNLGMLSNSQIALPTLPASVTNAVIDPLGAQPSYVGGGFGGVILRTNGGVTNVQLAEQLAGLPDTWTLVFEDLVNAASATQVTTNTNATALLVNPRNGQFTSNARYRIVMYDITGKLGVIRNLYQVISNTGLSWLDVDNTGTPLTATNALPAGFVPVKIRVETQSIRYSYLLTVRKKATTPGDASDQSWVADVDVAVFFNRPFLPSGSGKPGDETPFTLGYPVNGSALGAFPTPGMGFDNAPGIKGVDDDGANGVDDNNELGWPGSDDNRTVLVAVSSSGPYLKKGAYMLETTQLKWYRVVDFNASTGAVLLDQDIRYTGTTAANPTLNGIFLKGIVDVFPLGSRTGHQ